MAGAMMRFPHRTIRASAGTGKTFQLTNRYLGLLMAGELPERILATTFTRKAAGEILERVLLRLAKAAESDAQSERLGKEIGADGLTAARAREALAGLVRQLHRVQVCTLDSFFMRVAGSFSLELGLPPGWRVAEGVAEARLKLEAVRAVLNEAQPQRLVDLIRLMSKGELRRSVHEEIQSTVDKVYEVYMETGGMEAVWRAFEAPRGLEDVELAAAMEALTEVTLPENKDGSVDKTWLKGWQANLEAVRRGDWSGLMDGGVAKAIVEGKEKYSRKEIEAAVRAAYEPLLAHAKAEQIRRLVKQTEATYELLHQFDGQYWRQKLRRRLLGFADVTRLLATAALTGNLEEVYYRLDGQIGHLLLDEFQDTSRDQWRVIEPIAEEVYAYGDGSRSFFCVGDVKQAIYGWRGGVSELLDRLEEKLPGLEPASLVKSYRSSQVVIDTVNAVFKTIDGCEALVEHGQPTARWARQFEDHATAKDLAGYATLEVAPEAGEKEDQELRTVRYAAERVAEIVGQAPGRSVGVLVRRRKHIARLIYELRRLGVRASEEGGNRLTDSPAVMVVLSLLRLADHPGDRAACYHVAHSPLGKLVGLTRYEEEAAVVRVAGAVRRTLLEKGYARVVYGWAKGLAEACDPRDLSRLMQLVELAQRYEEDASVRPGDFVKFIEAQMVEDPVPAAVRVMTIHQSKGLQFDVVVLPELDVRLFGQEPPLVAYRSDPLGPIEQVCRYPNKALREMWPEVRRLYEQYADQVVYEALSVLYVAMTRAVHAVHMIVAPWPEKQKTMPCTFAGILRGTLLGDERVEAGEVAWEMGDPRWYERDPARGGEGVEVASEEVVERIELASSGRQRQRGLLRQTPSGMEGGGKVDLRWRLRLDTSTSRERGTLMHGWFERIGWLEDGRPAAEELRAEAVAAGWEKTQAEAMVAQFEAALDHPAFAAVLSRAPVAQHWTREGGAVELEVWRERPFAVRMDNAVVTGMFDRLVVARRGGRVIGAEVVDFKTDRVSEGGEEAVATLVGYYRPQVEAYRKVAARLLGLAVERVSARLAFVEAGVVRAVEDQAMAETT